MMKKLRYLGISATALLLCLLCLAGSALQPRAEAVDLFHYGISGVESNETVAPSVLFASLLGTAPTASEQAYLDELSGLKLTYNTAIPSNVATDYNGDTGILAVSVNPYVYTAANGATVTWVPTHATVGDRKLALTLSDGAYLCQFENLFHSNDFEMEIDYTCELSIPKATADVLFGASYAAATEAQELLNIYQSERAAYEALKSRYLAYEAYEAAVEAYNYYVDVELPAYEKAVEDYAPYAAHLEKVAAYEAWQQYWAYQEFMTGDVQAKYQAYQNYLKQIAPIQARLNVLETLFVQDSHGWQLYGSLMGGTVDTVLANRDKLIEYGESKGKKKEFTMHISNAGSATDALRKLMKEYSSLRSAKYASEHWKLTALYNFYAKNHSTLSENFSKLYEALEYLGYDGLVRGTLSAEGKLERYDQFVGQLYITQACLDDKEVMGPASQVVVCRTNYLKDVVEPLHILTDGTASPKGVSMPATEVPKVEKVEQIDKPQVEEIRVKPKWDGKIPETPVEPTVVTKPDEANAPTLPDEPLGDEPKAPVFATSLQALMTDLKAGTLPKRVATKDSYSYTLHHKAIMPVSIRNLKTVTFYGYDGKTILDQQTLDYGSRVIYKGPDMTRASDEKSHYEFLGWVTLPDKTAVELVATSNMSLYAYYLETPRFYRVTWILDGKTESQTVQAGVDPAKICPFITQKSPDRAYTYTFSGWDKELSPVYSDVTYRGSFLATPQEYTVTWVLGDRVETEQVAYGEVPVYSGDTAKPADDYRYEFLGWDFTPTAVKGDVTYTARYRNVALAKNETNVVLRIEHTEDAIRIYVEGARADVREAALLAQESAQALEIFLQSFSLRIEAEDLSTLTESRCRKIGIFDAQVEGNATVYRVGYLNGAGTLLDLQIPSQLTMLENEEGGTYVGYLLFDADEWVTVEDGTSLEGEFSIRVKNVFKMDVVSNEPCNLSRLPVFFEADAEVDLSLIGCVFGYEITSATLVLEDGSRLPVDAMRFVMPNAALTVELTISKIIYNVSFTVDGVVIHTEEVDMGEEIIPPANPTKATDDKFSYKFAGWSPEPSIAFGEERDLVFEATFSTTPVGTPFVGDRSQFIKLLTTVICIAAAVLAVIVALIVFLCIRKRKKKRKAEAIAAAVEVTESSAKSEVTEAENTPKENEDD